MIEDNQTYIDSKKNMYGKQGSLSECCCLYLGVDSTWWLFPTHPELKINFFERLWPKKAVKSMYKSNVFDQEEDDSDLDKKHFSVEQRRA